MLSLPFFGFLLHFVIADRSTLVECVFLLAGATKIYPSIILFKYLFEEKKKKYFFLEEVLFS